MTRTSIHKLASFTLAVLALNAISACDDPQEKTAESAPPSAESRAQIEAVLSRYEDVRAHLAGDRIEAAAASAETLARASRAAAANAPEGLRPHLAELEAAATRLRTTSEDGADEVRAAFGQASEPLVTLLASEPGLQGGLHVFECPMAEGYGRWVQPGETISNPYMGERMPRCGTEVGW
jgi:hypothetical protein